MILKQFEPYDLTLGLTALQKRLSAKHEKFQLVTDDLNKLEAGEKGEAYVINLLESNSLPQKTVVLHNVSFIRNIETQIDILVISENWCLILEVKNIKGTLYFQHNPKQLIRLNEDGKEENLGSPETQVELYKMALRSLLTELRIDLPVYGAIVFAYQNAIIKTPPAKIPIAVGRELLTLMTALQQVQGKSVDPILVGNKILKNLNTRNPFPLCKAYDISEKQIIKGVECPGCGTFSMKRTLRTWYCQKCHQTSMYAHVQALKDYGMLISANINTKEALEFLKLRNRYEAIRIVKQNSIQHVGASRSSRYELNTSKPGNKISAKTK